MDLTNAQLVAILAIEAAFVLLLAPRITRRYVHKDVDAIINGKVAPVVEASVAKALGKLDELLATAVNRALADATTKLDEAIGKLPTAEALEQTIQDAVGEAASAINIEEGQREFSRAGVAARETIRLNEEKLVAAIYQKFGAGPGALLAEQCKQTFPAHWKAVVKTGERGFGPMLDKLASMMPGAKNQQQPAQMGLL